MASRTYDDLGVTVSAYELPANESESSFLDAVEQILKRIGGSVTGRAVFVKIKAHGQVLIVPFTEQYARAVGQCNAESVPVVSPQVAQVAFSPRTFSLRSRCSVGPGSFPDIVLLHELVHAGRKLGRDFQNARLTGALAPYETEEEYFAVLIENIYSSETRGDSRGLRADHSSTKVLESPDDDPEVFLSNPDNFNLVTKYCDQHPTIAPMIAHANGYFNPIRVYFDWDKEYPDKPVFHPKVTD